MKNVFILLILSLFLVGFTNPQPENNDKPDVEYNISSQDSQGSQDIISDYCDGWEEGYCEGWRDVKGQYAICPITPICPIAEIGKTSYRDGYNRGFKAGRAKAKSSLY